MLKIGFIECFWFSGKRGKSKQKNSFGLNGKLILGKKHLFQRARATRMLNAESTLRTSKANTMFSLHWMLKQAERCVDSSYEKLDVNTALTCEGWTCMGDWIDEEKNVCQAISDSYREIVSMMEKKVVFLKLIKFIVSWHQFFIVSSLLYIPLNFRHFRHILYFKILWKLSCSCSVMLNLFKIAAEFPFDVHSL